MTDLSDIQVTLTHNDVEHVIREELRDAIRIQKIQINSLNRAKVPLEHEDLVFGKVFIRAAAVVLKYYTVPKDWKELDEISD